MQKKGSGIFHLSKGSPLYEKQQKLAKDGAPKVKAAVKSDPVAVCTASKVPAVLKFIPMDVSSSRVQPRWLEAPKATMATTEILKFRL